MQEVLILIKVNIPLVNSSKGSQEGSAIKSTLRSPVGLSGEFFGVWERTVNELMKDFFSPQFQEVCSCISICVLIMLSL